MLYRRGCYLLAILVAILVARSSAQEVLRPFLSKELRYSHLPNNTDLHIGVLIDEEWVNNNGQQIQDLKQLVETTVQRADELYLALGQTTLHFRTDIKLENDYGSDLDIIISILDCSKSHSLSRRLEEFAVMHIALTGVGCKRITRKNGLLLPYIEGKDAVVQILTDLRNSNTINWKSYIFIHDETVDEMLSQHIYDSLSQDSAVTSYSINSKQLT